MKYLRPLIKNNQGVLGYFFALVFSISMLVFLFSFAIPFLINFTTDMYIAGDNLIANTETKISEISNETIRTKIQNNLDNIQAATAENIEYMSFFVQYSWILITLIVTFTLFILARRVVETKGYGGIV